MMTVVKEGPLLFSQPMVKATRELIKTNTRRVMITQPSNGWGFENPPIMGRINSKHPKQGKFGAFIKRGVGTEFPEADIIVCPYGKPGDRLWIKETHYMYGKWVKNGKTRTGRQRWKFKRLSTPVRYYDDAPEKVRSSSYRKSGWYKRPSIFMPRWASRILLEITDIRVERVQGISEADAKAEGVGMYPSGLTAWKDFIPYVSEFKRLWDSINADRGYGWDVNPWVWVIEFKNITENKGV
jgi:hypothetical protein